MSTLSSPPVLIVDKEGLLGSALARELEQKHIVIFVSKKHLIGKNIIFVPFTKKIPTIPDNSFSKIFVVYSGEKEIEEALPAFAAKARQTKADLFFMVSIFHYRDKLPGHLFSLYPQSYVLVVGDVFTQEVQEAQTPVTALLAQARHEGFMQLTNSGLDILFPIALQDVIQTSIAVAFTQGESSTVYAILPQHPVTQLSFARLIQKHYPLLRVDFSKHKLPQSLYHLPTSAQPVSSDYPLERRLAVLPLEFDPKVTGKTPMRLRPKRQRKGAKSLLAVLFASIFFILALPFLLALGGSLAGGAFLKAAADQVDHGHLESALSSVKAASSTFAVADSAAQVLGTAGRRLGLKRETDYIQGLAHTGYEISGIGIQLLSSGIAFQSLLGSVNEPTKQAYLDALNKLKEGLSSLQAIRAENSLPQTYKDDLNRIQEPLSLVSNLLDSTPTLFGFDGERHYLVLFQNNFELRPGGGFIGSYGLVSMKSGRVSDISIHNVYDADGKLTADITPPFPLQRFMGASHWFLRDSNFDPDFPTSASQAASFLKLETGQNIDGVIGIDVSFLSSLLGATGPIQLPDYKQQLTQDNFYLLTQSQAEENSFPGSTQKQDFLRASEQALLSHLQKGQFSYQKMVTILAQAVIQKHLLFAFPDPTMQKLFSVNNLSGDIAERRLPQKNTVLDVLGASEANIGQNKSNYYLRRSIGQSVTIDGDGQIREVVSYTYTNTSDKTSKFGGNYKAYLRVLVPQNATLTEVDIDQQEQKVTTLVDDPRVYLARSFKAPQGFEVEQGSEKGRKVIGALITVPMGQTKTITFSYTLSDKAAIDALEWHYDLLAFKQPGTLSDPYKLTLMYPVDIKLLRSSIPVSDFGGRLIFESNLSQDRSLNLTFTQR